MKQFPPFTVKDFQVEASEETFGFKHFDLK